MERARNQQTLHMWTEGQESDQRKARTLSLPLPEDVWHIMSQEARDRHLPVEDLISNLVRLAAMKSEYNETIYSAVAPIGLV